MKKHLLIIGAGVEACEGIKTARAMGLKLFIADGNPQAPGFAYADEKIVASTYDGDAIIAALNKLHVKLDGAIAMCADVPLSVAKIAQAFGLPGLSIESAMWVSDKLLMKQRLQEMGIPVPRFFSVESASALVQVAEDLGYPFIVKPVDSRGARGVQYLEDESQLAAAFELAKQESPTQRVMAEEYLAGPQISTETLIDNGECFTLGFADRNYEWLERTKPFLIENGGDSPSALPQEAKAEVIKTVEQAALALGITQGVAKGDMVYTSSGAKVIEIAGRLSGGYFSTTQIPIATGVNFVEQAIKLALGFPLKAEDVEVKCHRGVAIRYLDLPAGKIRDLDGISEAKNIEGLELLSIFIQSGSEIKALANHTQRSGFAICSAETKQQAITRAQDALSRIKVDYAH